MLLRAVFPVCRFRRSPTARGSRSRRCWRRSSAVSAQCSVRCSARWWCRLLGEAAKLVAGDAPGLDLVIYGCVLILVVAFAPGAASRACSRTCATRAAIDALARSRGRSRAWLMPLLTVEGISKRFGGSAAVSDASLERRSGRITALIGPNGAGKTTLFAMIAGFQRPDRGRVYLRRRRYHGRAAAPAGAAAASRARSRSCSHSPGSRCAKTSPSARICVSRARQDALAAASRGRETRSGSAISSTSPAATLTVAGRKRLELARALATGAETAAARRGAGGPQSVGNSRHAAGHLARSATRGVTILMIEHVMQAVMSLAEQVYVLAEGRDHRAGRAGRGRRQSAGDRGLSGPGRRRAVLAPGARGVR